MYPRRRLLLACTPLLALGGIAVYAALKLAPASFETVATAPQASPVGGPFELVDHTGRTVTDRTFRGTLMLIYFGYSSCPDLCPTSLGDLAAALNLLGPSAEQVSFLFITVDPARDTPAHLAGYVGLFHPRLIGLSGSETQCAQVARAFRVYVRFVPSAEHEGYIVDHSSFAYLVAPDGRLLTAFPHGTPPETIAEAMRRAL
jgi:cytochrome oxidase Cu insertion factor (SCO1/SenC/PrrC family)